MKLNVTCSEDAVAFVARNAQDASEMSPVRLGVARLLYGQFLHEKSDHFNFAFPEYELDEELPHFYVGKLRVTVMEPEYVPLVQNKHMVMAACGSKVEFVECT